LLSEFEGNCVTICWESNRRPTSPLNKPFGAGWTPLAGEIDLDRIRLRAFIHCGCPVVYFIGIPHPIPPWRSGNQCMKTTNESDLSKAIFYAEWAVNIGSKTLENPKGKLTQSQRGAIGRNLRRSLKLLKKMKAIEAGLTVADKSN
jgi:hypothetical protein